MSPSRPGPDPESGLDRRAASAKPPASKARVQAFRRDPEPLPEPLLVQVSLPLREPAPEPVAAPPDEPTAAASPAGPARRPAVPGRTASAKNVRGARPAARPPEDRRVTPILVRQIRGAVAESSHRGSIVEVAIDGSIQRLIGDPETLVNMRSAVKPFGLVAFVEAGGIAEFDLSGAELAVMAGSHSGEDLHVRTLQGVFRRAGVSQQYLGCGAEGAPLDALTAARLSRDGEKPGPIRHMCSGQHASILLLCRMNGWPLDEYWLAEHPVQRLYAATIARAFDTLPELLLESIDACGVPTYAFQLHEIARAYAMLADPTAIPPSDARSSLAPALVKIRDAMVANPDMVAGTRDRLDSSVMKALPGRVLSKGGAEGLRGFSILPGGGKGARGIAIKIEDGGGYDRAISAASVETLRQVGVVDDAALRALGRYHRPVAFDPRGEQVGVAMPEFELAPVGEML